MAKQKHSTPQAPPRQCLFCSNNANSPEHLWPDWMSPHFTRTAHDASEEYSLDFNPHTSTGVPVRKQRHGHPTRLKLKVVCRKCNNGWMSEIESAAKPFIEPMLLGKRTTLNAHAQRAIAVWVTLKMMVFERATWTQPVFTRAQTLAFGISKAPADNLKIWLLHTLDPYASVRATRGYAGLFKNAEDAVGKPPTPNTQTVMFGIGQLLIFSVHSQLADFVLGKLVKRSAKRLWPLRPVAVTWPPRDSLNGAEAMDVAMSLQNYLARVGTAVRP